MTTATHSFPVTGQRDIATVKNAVNLADYIGRSVSLNKKSSTLYKAICPFHDDRNPSFDVYDDEGEWKWYCHGCKKGGDAIDFAREKYGLTIAEAINRVAEDAGLNLNRVRVLPRPAGGKSWGFSPTGPNGEPSELEKIFDYTDENGNLLYQAARFK